MFNWIRRLLGLVDEHVVDEFEDHVIDSIEADDGNRYEKRADAQKTVDFSTGAVQVEQTGDARVVRRE